jgi:tight adherence protein C
MLAAVAAGARRGVNMNGTPVYFLALLALAGCALSIPGLRGLFEIRAALRQGELDRLAAPGHWPATRIFCGLCAAVPVYLAAAPLGASAMGAALCVAGIGYAVAPLFLAAARQRVGQRLLDELALHLDLMALVLESGGSLSNAILVCAERAPDGPLRRVWARAVLEVHAGTPLAEALRALDQRVGLRPLTTLVLALRSADRAGFDLAGVVRERARQAAASRFARAERLARAAPLKLWATMMLCIAPCSLLLLAFPVARLLALIVDR